jgi:hypothetical protein
MNSDVRIYLRYDLSSSDAVLEQSIMHATPFSAYRRAMERPIPRPGPVTSTTLEGWDSSDFVGSMAGYMP